MFLFAITNANAAFDPLILLLLALLIDIGTGGIGIMIFCCWIILQMEGPGPKE